MKLNVMILLIIATLQFGCVSIQRPCPGMDQAAKRFESQQDKGVVYLYRPQSLAPLSSIQVYMNDRLLGVSKPKSYLLITMPPSDLKFKATANNTAVVGLKTDSGGIYFVRMELEIGLLGPNVTLTIVDPSIGKKEVVGCDLLGNPTK